MTKTIVMPDLGFDAESGLLANWLIKVGDEVGAGDPIAEIESDKVTLEVEAEESGSVLELLANVGEVVAVGAPLVRLGTPGEAAPRPQQETGAGEVAPADSPATSQEAAISSMAKPDRAPVLPTPAGGLPRSERGSVPVSERRATPVAERMASEHGLDLRAIQGSGPGERILKADVETYLSQAESDTSSSTDADPPAGSAPAELKSQQELRPHTSVPAPGKSSQLTPLRQAIGQRMATSKRTVPHFYITVRVEMDAALALRAQINATLPAEQKVTVNDLVVKASALALRNYPALNASFEDDQIVHHDEIHVGIAVAVEGGLLTVVNRNTDRATISAVAATNRALIQRARAGRVKPGDVSGATFTVSNLGAFDVEHFAPIISPPQAAILGVATASRVPVVVEEEGMQDRGEERVVVRSLMRVTLSADHRVTDGAEAAQFLQRLRALLEAPMQLLI